MTIAPQRPGATKTIDLFEEPRPEFFVDESGDTPLESDPLKKYSKADLAKAVSAYREKYKGVQLVFKRVLDTVYSPWPYLISELELAEEQACERARAENADNKDHNCHRRGYKTKEYRAKDSALTREILTSCLIGSHGIAGFADGVLTDEEERKALIETLIINKLGDRAVSCAFTSQGLTTTESLF